MEDALINILTQTNIDLENNEIGVMSMRWLVKANWSNIKSIDLGKNDVNQRKINLGNIN
jgi:hypothetical protein